jgi:hypothetical protein
MEDIINEDIRKNGWSALSVSDADPPFLYTVGLMQSWNHPELVIFGLESGEAHRVISLIVQSISCGGLYRDAGTFSGLERSASIGIRAVHPTQHPLFLGYAMGQCRAIGRWGELQTVQIFWPVKNGKFPFDPGCDLETFRRQPRLDIPLTPPEIAEFERKWE